MVLHVTVQCSKREDSCALTLVNEISRNDLDGMGCDVMDASNEHTGHAGHEGLIQPNNYSTKSIEKNFYVMRRLVAVTQLH